MRKIQILRGTFAKKPELEDGQMYLAKDTKQVFVGDKAITEGEVELANKSDLTTLTNEVNTQASDIADIQADYAQTTGGNTVTANGVVISDENGKLKSVAGNANQIVQFNSDKVPVAVDADFASKSDLNNYLPLSGGTLTGNIKVEPNDDTFRIFRQNTNENVSLDFQESTCILSTDERNGTSAYIQLALPGSIVLGQITKNGVGTKITISDDKAEIRTTLEGQYTPTSEASLVNKVYVDNAISAISSVNIAVSETQPTNQKVGDFWYKITGTV